MSKSKHPNIEKQMPKSSQRKYERWEIFGRNGESNDTWLWCLHCERAYQVHEIRVLKHPFLTGETLEMCAYEGCDGDSVMDAKTWPPREGFPGFPEKDVVYPLYPDDDK